jgi:hypothetical protein
MAKYRKRPAVVEAEQWFPGRDVAGVQPGVEGEYGPFVQTAHGQRAFLAPGDWVIAEPDNRGFYPCKDDIFRASYEPA